MPHKYSRIQKLDALELLERNGGDIAATALQTGIPERSLYRWRSELWQIWRRQTPPPPSPKPLPQFADDLEALAFLRQKIMTELLNLANNYPEGLNYVTPTQRIVLQSQLLNHLMLLDEHLKPYRPQPQITHKVIGSEGQEPDGDVPDLTAGASESGRDSSE